MVHRGPSVTPTYASGECGRCVMPSEDLRSCRQGTRSSRKCRRQLMNAWRHQRRPGARRRDRDRPKPTSTTTYRPVRYTADVPVPSTQSRTGVVCGGGDDGGGAAGGVGDGGGDGAFSQVHVGSSAAGAPKRRRPTPHGGPHTKPLPHFGPVVVHGEPSVSRLRLRASHEVKRILLRRRPASVLFSYLPLASGRHRAASGATCASSKGDNRAYKQSWLPKQGMIFAFRTSVRTPSYHTALVACP